MAHFFQIKKLNTSYHIGIEFFDFEFVTQDSIHFNCQIPNYFATLLGS